MKKAKFEIETFAHKLNIQVFIGIFVTDLLRRGVLHDNSKLKSPEFEIFAEISPTSKTLTYGSDEYKAGLKELEVALEHHYDNNSHHPEHYENGIDGMTLFDIVEMFCDWMAATERHDDGCIYKSLEFNKNRFGMSDQLYSILLNTAIAIRGRKDE